MNTNYYTWYGYQHCAVCVLTLCVLQQFILHRSGTVEILNSSVSFHLVHTNMSVNMVSRNKQDSDLCFTTVPLNQYEQEYIRDKSVQPRILACITTFFENDIVKRHAWAW